MPVILVGPMLEQLLDLAVDGDKAVRPKRNTAFVQALIYLLAGRFEHSGSGDHHLEFTI